MKKEEIATLVKYRLEQAQIADYKIIEPVSPEKAKESLAKAYSFVEAVQKYIQSL
ncbi:MAG: hypothetical protein AABZ85_04595 [Thermodesulfobacteriota bacterium]